MARKRKAYDAWDGQRVQALRKHLGLTQQQMADELGTRQQTISEWETGVYQPRGASRTLLTFIAERAGFQYLVSSEDASGEKGRPG
ncbi:MAG: helix-turn-helix transcriptional regulator [Chloroflexota bacterium]|nr:helix-turn-helix transcriptional regulator [Chloroflexota bacterium]